MPADMTPVLRLRRESRDSQEATLSDTSYVADSGVVTVVKTRI